MAQTSTTLISSKQHLADIGPGTVISFTQNGTEYKMLSGDTDSITFAAIKQFDLITITGSSLNNKTFTVKSDATAGEVVFEEATVNETSDGSTTMLVNMSGCVSDKPTSVLSIDLNSVSSKNSYGAVFILLLPSSLSFHIFDNLDRV